MCLCMMHLWACVYNLVESILLPFQLCIGSEAGIQVPKSVHKLFTSGAL